jgi:hypothetical protein
MFTSMWLLVIFMSLFSGGLGGCSRPMSQKGGAQLPKIEIANTIKML